MILPLRALAALLGTSTLVWAQAPSNPPAAPAPTAAAVFSRSQFPEPAVPASGALITYSPAPGLYTLYDYSQAIHFHDRLIPSQFTITESGRTIVEAKTIGVSEPPQDAALFDTAGLTETGVGSLMTSPWSIRRFAPSPASTSNASDIVVLHGMQSAAGQITDVEMLASSNGSLNSQALEVVSQLQGRMATPTSEEEPGATLQSHEVLLTIQFASARR